MRYHPSTFGQDPPETIGASDSEEEPPMLMDGVEVPEVSRTLNKAGKRKHGDLNGDEAPAKKHKKHKSTDETQSSEKRKARKEEKKKKRDKERSGAKS